MRFLDSQNYRCILMRIWYIQIVVYVCVGVYVYLYYAWMHGYTYMYINITVKLMTLSVVSKAVCNVFSLHSVDKHFSSLKITLNSFFHLSSTPAYSQELQQNVLLCVLAYELGDKFPFLSSAALLQSLLKLCFPCLALLRWPFWTRSTTVLQPLRSSMWHSPLSFTVLLLTQQHLKQNFNL